MTSCLSAAHHSALAAPSPMRGCASSAVCLDKSLSGGTPHGPSDTNTSDNLFIILKTAYSEGGRTVNLCLGSIWCWPHVEGLEILNRFTIYDDESWADHGGQITPNTLPTTGQSYQMMLQRQPKIRGWLWFRGGENTVAKSRPDCQQACTPLAEIIPIQCLYFCLLCVLLPLDPDVWSTM